MPSRRDFIKGATAGAAALVGGVVPQIVKATPFVIPATELAATGWATGSFTFAATWRMIGEIDKINGNDLEDFQAAYLAPGGEQGDQSSLSLSYWSEDIDKAEELMDKFQEDLKLRQQFKWVYDPAKVRK